MVFSSEFGIQTGEPKRRVFRRLDFSNFIKKNKIETFILGKLESNSSEVVEVSRRSTITYDTHNSIVFVSKSGRQNATQNYQACIKMQATTIHGTHTSTMRCTLQTKHLTQYSKKNKVVNFLEFQNFFPSPY